MDRNSFRLEMRTGVRRAGNSCGDMGEFVFRAMLLGWLPDVGKTRAGVLQLCSQPPLSSQCPLRSRDSSAPQPLGAAVPRAHCINTALAGLDLLPNPHLLPVRQGCKLLFLFLLLLPALPLLPLCLLPLLPLGFLCPFLLQLLGLHLLCQGPWHLRAEGRQPSPTEPGAMAGVGEESSGVPLLVRAEGRRPPWHGCSHTCLDGPP